VRISVVAPLPTPRFPRLRDDEYVILTIPDAYHFFLSLSFLLASLVILFL
jgi:hypothetical protein